jgi:putative endonuclease
MPVSIPLNRAELGKEAEEIARSYLIAQGLKIVLENFRCRSGELDLVAFHGKELVIAEVRMRTQVNYAGAAASVGPHKRARIISATRYLLLTHPKLGRHRVRFDVVALDRAAAQDHSRIEWIRNAFEARSW